MRASIIAHFVTLYFVCHDAAGHYFAQAFDKMVSQPPKLSLVLSRFTRAIATRGDDFLDYFIADTSRARHLPTNAADISGGRPQHATPAPSAGRHIGPRRRSFLRPLAAPKCSRSAPPAAYASRRARRRAPMRRRWGCRRIFPSASARAGCLIIERAVPAARALTRHRSRQ